MRVLAAFGAGGRRKYEHAFDSEWHLRGGLNNHNLAVRARMARQIDQAHMLFLAHC